MKNNFQKYLKGKNRKHNWQNGFYWKADTSKITLHMVASLDGYIAKKDNSVAWFNTADYFSKGIDEPDSEAFFKTVDCFIMGALTYEHAFELSKEHGWPYGDVPTIVVTHRNLTVERNNISLYSGNLTELIKKQLKPAYKNIWVAGGAKLSNEFLRLQLADEIRLSILPVLLGDGLPFFDKTEIEKSLHLKDVSAFKNGMVELWYEIKKNKT